MNIPAYIIINSLLISSWYIFLFRKKEFVSFADRLIGTFVLSLTQIIATQMLLGVVFEKLYPVPLLLLNLIISISVLVLGLKTGGCRGVFDEIKDETVRIFRIIKEDKILLCIYGLFLVSICWLFFVGYLFPSYSWDALYYHIPIVGQIIQSGAIQEIQTPSFIQQYINIFSKNINLFFLWNVIFLKSEIIVDLSQLFFTIAGVLAIYSMAVKLKIKEKYAIYSSLLFFFSPMIILQSTTNYVDCAVSMLFLVALNFLIYDDEGICSDNNPSVSDLKERRIPILLSGLASGILLGSKPTGPLFMIVTAGAVLIKIIVEGVKSAAPKSRERGCILRNNLRIYMIYFIAPALLIGGYWYFRNWIYYGNPVYYMDVSFFNITLFKGLKTDWVEPAPAVIDNLSYLTRLLYVWLEKVEYYMYDSRLSGFGPVWFILFIPSIIFSLVYAVTKKKYSYLFICMILLVTFIIHPRNWTTRYVIFIVGLGALSFGYVFDYFSKRENIFRIFALLLAGYTFATANSPCVMPEKVKEFLFLPRSERTLSRHKPFNIDVKVRDEYGYWIWIEKNIKKGDTLAYTFVDTVLDTSKPFFLAPLWNHGYSNKVIYIKSDDYKEWLKKLKENKATYILTTKNSVEDRWIEKERKLYYSLRWVGSVKEKFRVVYDDANYKIVQFVIGKGQTDEG